MGCASSKNNNINNTTTSLNLDNNEPKEITGVNSPKKAYKSQTSYLFLNPESNDGSNKTGEKEKELDIRASEVI